jgi:hypothetical protein
MIMGISRVYMIIYGILVYHMFRHTHIFHAKVLSKEFHWQNATLHIASTATWWMQASCPCGMRVYPLVVVRDPALQYIHVLKKKGLQWLLHVPTKRNLKVVAATMIHCAKFAELLTSHPVPLSPSSTVNWSRGECHVNMRSKVNYILQKQFAPVKVCGEYTICHHNRTAFRLPPPGTACVLCSLYTGLKFSQAVSRSSPKTETSGYLFGLKITRPWQVPEYDWVTICKVNILSWWKKCRNDTGHIRSYWSQFSWRLETESGFHYRIGPPSYKLVYKPL